MDKMISTVIQISYGMLFPFSQKGQFFVFKIINI